MSPFLQSRDVLIGKGRYDNRRNCYGRLGLPDQIEEGCPHSLVPIEHSFLLSELFPDLAAVFPRDGSLYQFLQEHYDARVLSVEQTLQPIQLTGELDGLLEEKQGILGILTRLMACTNKEKPVEYSWSVVSSGKCMFCFWFREEEPDK